MPDLYTWAFGVVFVLCLLATADAWTHSLRNKKSLLELIVALVLTASTVVAGTVLVLRVVVL